MKIAIWHNLPSGGGKRALYYHVLGLVKRGHIVESWCPPTADQTYLPLREIIPEHIVPFPRPSGVNKIRLVRLVKGFYGVTEGIKSMHEHCLQCAKEMNFEGFDLLFANSCSLYGTASIGKYVKIPKIIYLGEPYRHLYEALPKLPWTAVPAAKSCWSLSYLKTIAKDLIDVQRLRVQMREEWENAQSFDMILVNSRFSRESVMRAYGRDSKVSYLGIDTELFRPTARSRERLVVGLGSIQYHKGIDRAVSALGTIGAAKRPNLVWIGNGVDHSFRQNMEEFAASLGVNLRFLLRISDQEMVDWLSRAAALIYTSRLEPFGFAPLEANACGTPVVAIAEGGVRESIREGINGFLVDDDDPTGIGESILKLLENQNLAREMGEKARQYVLENWTWEKALDRLETLIMGCCSKKKNTNEKN